MTRRVFFFALSFAACVASAAAPGLVACSSDDAAAPAADAAIDAVAVDLCSAFTSNGAVCPAVSRTVCFAECATGGCSCIATAAGPRWKCVTDLSCMPDARPVDFDARTDLPDAGDVPDASDVADAASVDAPGDAPGDADVGDAHADASD